MSIFLSHSTQHSPFAHRCGCGCGSVCLCTNRFLAFSVLPSLATYYMEPNQRILWLHVCVCVWYVKISDSRWIVANITVSTTAWWIKWRHSSREQNTWDWIKNNWWNLNVKERKKHTQKEWKQFEKDWKNFWCIYRGHTSYELLIKVSVHPRGVCVCIETQ